MTIEAVPYVPGFVTISNFGKELTCRCARVLLFKDMGDRYVAKCFCGRVVSETKRGHRERKEG